MNVYMSMVVMVTNVVAVFTCFVVVVAADVAIEIMAHIGWAIKTKNYTVLFFSKFTSGLGLPIIKDNVL